ncbi:ribosomal protein S18-alanine N-acetyltransferase [Marinobacterium jannaschii]|uniref:ribosomal protein S18-alanine N-acetyltransferase n=1 Tax=Marinobacterium jannaschii TaxID=64970 RepID=UPI000486E8C0|nr:ribosomal protein S18-alanine N-acetyltransferase [Marinobacterium jannaschii]
MNKLLIRPLAEADLNSWVALECAVFAEPWSETQLAGWLNRERTLALGVFAPESRQLQGFALYSYILDEAELLQIAVAFEARGLGLASGLMRQAGEQLKSLGVGRILLEVRDSNLAARNCYRTYGFSEEGVRKGYYKGEQGREDAVLMSLSL